MPYQPLRSESKQNRPLLPLKTQDMVPEKVIQKPVDRTIWHETYDINFVDIDMIMRDELA